MGGTKTGYVKKIIFTLFIVVLFFMGLSITLTKLEEAGIIGTERPDDKVAYGPIRILATGEGDNKKDWVVVESSMIPNVFSKKKPRNTFRAFVTGGSFALGSPYVSQATLHNPEVAISDWMRMELQVRFPKRKFEIINAAAGGQNTHRVKAIVQRLSAEDADLIVVAAGNNEGYVPRTKLNDALHQWIVYRALKKTIKPGAAAHERSYFAPQDESSRAIIDGFHQNIDEMVQVCNRNGMKLALATLPINLRYSGPDPTATGTGIKPPVDDEWIKKGRAAQKAGKYEQAVKYYLKSDNKVYVSRYIGECMDALGRYDQARDFYKVFVQNNPLNRARPAFNDYIRLVAKQYDSVILIDLERYFESLSEGGIPHPKTFLDYCHMPWWGYQLMASKILDDLMGAGILEGEPGPKPSVDDLISRNGMEKELSFYRETQWRNEPGVVLTSPRSIYPPPDI